MRDGRVGMGLSGAIRAYLGLVLFSILGTIVSKFLRLDPGPIAPVASVLTLLAGTWAAIRPARPFRWVMAAGMLGAASEIVGLATGFPFGRYAYTERWFPTLGLPGVGPFPLLLPFAWLLVAGAAERICRPLAAIPAALAAGGLAATIDLVMEPVATGPLGYWRWLEPGPLPGGAPLGNFAGWFAVSALGAVLLRRTAPPYASDRREAAFVLAGHLALFAVVAAMASFG